MNNKIVKLTNDEQIMKNIGETPSDLVFWSFRYFLGRRTIHATVFAENLAKTYPYLNNATQQMIKKEIERAKELGELGDACDQEAWQKVRNMYVAEKDCQSFCA